MLNFDLELSPGPQHGSLRAAATVAKGVTLLSGPSGAGKSTLLALLAGAIPPQRGTLRWNGLRWSEGPACLVPSHLRGLGWQPQLPSLVPHWSAVDHLRATARHRPPAGEVALRAASALGLTPLLSRPVSTLSTGEAQRVALLRALTACRGLLLLDEPVTALQPPLAREALQLVHHLTEAHGWATIIVSHQPLDGIKPTGILTMESGQLA